MSRPEPPTPTARKFQRVMKPGQPAAATAGRIVLPYPDQTAIDDPPWPAGTPEVVE